MRRRPPFNTPNLIFRRSSLVSLVVPTVVAKTRAVDIVCRPGVEAILRGDVNRREQAGAPQPWDEEPASLGHVREKIWVAYAMDHLVDEP